MKGFMHQVEQLFRHVGSFECTDKGRVLFACFLSELDERVQQAPTRFPTQERSWWNLQRVVSRAWCSVWGLLHTRTLNSGYASHSLLILARLYLRAGN